MPYAIMYHDDVTETREFNVGSTPSTLNRFVVGGANGIEVLADYAFRIRIPGTYRVLFATSF